MTRTRTCVIEGCRRILSYPSFWVFTLDDGRNVEVCPSCARKINAARKELAA